MLYGLQKRFDKNGDGKLKGAEWQRWYQYAYGDEIEAKEKRRRANAAAEQKRAQIAADFADHVSDLINWMYRDLAHLEREREDQAIRTMHLALYVISAALQTQTIDESMRYLLRAFWNEFQPTFDESVYQALCAKQIMFAEIGEISEKRLGSFWRNLLDNLPPERRVGKDDDLQELLDDTSRLYNYFRDDSAPGIDFAKEIEPYWAAIRLPEEPEEAEEYDEDEEPGEESEPWKNYYEKAAPEGNGGGYYQFCKVQFKDGGSPYAYLTGGLPLAVGDFVLVPVGNRNAEKTGRVTDIFVCSAQDAPYPPEKAKFVLRKSEQTAFPEKKTPPIEPAKNEKAAAPMPPVPVEPPAAQSAPEEPASFEAEPVPEAPTFTLPPLPKQDEPKKPKRRIPWGWLAAGVAAVAFFVFALPPLKRTAEANRQMVIAQQAAEQEKREQEEQRAEQARLEEEAAAQRRCEEKQTRIEALQNADLPYPGMPYEELTSTKLGEASKVTHEMRSGQVCYTFVWQIRVGDYLYPVFVVTTENEEVLTAEQRNLEYWNDMALKGTICHQPEYKPSTPSQNQTGGTNHGSNGLRDEYDNPEDLYEDNPDWFEDEDEAWDEWEDG